MNDQALTGIIHEPAFPWAAWTLGPLLVVGLMACGIWSVINPKKAREFAVREVLPVTLIAKAVIGFVSLVATMAQYWF